MSCRPAPRLLRSLTGLDQRKNDVLFVDGSSPGKPPKGSVVFFPGDVQDLIQVQEQHRDNRRYTAWSLENTAQILADAFPQRNILIIRPARKTYQTFSCFDNFVKSDSVGSPCHSEDHGALRHLGLLLEKVEGADASHQRVPDKLILVGFSKGVVVLNQILYELSTRVERAEPVGLDLVRLVWLDGGHNGGQGTSVTDRSVVKNFGRLGVQVSIRVTPYQDQDSRRPWIHSEGKLFYRLLKENGVEAERSNYFQDEIPSIENHFKIIQTLGDKSWDD